MIHRDLKPSNLLLADQPGTSVGDVYIVDFGAVQTLAATEGGTITIVGTYGYMPPEQFGGRTSPASDLYSLGATLIYLVTGRHPADLPQQQLRLQFEPLTTLSVELKRWLACLVEPSLDRRLTSADAALHRLNNCFTPEPISLEGPHSTTTQLALEQPKESKVELLQSAERITIRFPQSQTLVTPKIPEAYNLPLWLLLIATAFLIEPVLLVIPALLWLQKHQAHQLQTNKKHQPLTQSNVLHIDQHQITLRLYAEDKLVQCNTSPRQTITGVEYRSDLEGHNALIIWAEKQHTLDSNQSLSSKDLTWLAHALGQWLDLPVQQTRKYQALPAPLFQNQTPTVLPNQAVVEKPHDSKVILLKQLGWIDILIPVESNQAQESYDRLYIDQQQICQTCIFQQAPPPSLRLSIRALEHHSNSDGYGDFIKIWAGQLQYVLGGEGSLSSSEMHWLAYELSEWLKLPIIQT